MDTTTLLNNIGDVTFSRNDIQEQAKLLDPRFRNTQMRYLIGKMIDDGLIVRVSHGIYQKVTDQGEKLLYENSYSDDAQCVIQILKEKYPLLNYRVWELNWLNEFFNHQIAQNKIILEVEKDGCEFVYDYLFDSYQGRVLLCPSPTEIYHYGIDGTMIIEKLISEAPVGYREKYNVPLEKIIVDLFSNKTIQAVLSKGDYPAALEDMFHKYQINQTALFRYARRRNRENEIYQFLKDRTNIELLRSVSK